MTEKDIETYLNQTKSIYNSITSLKIMLSDMDKFKEYYTAISYQNYEELKAEYNSQVTKYLGNIEERRKLIYSTIPGTTEESVLMLRYISGKSWKEIGAILNYSERQLTNFKKQGLLMILERVKDESVLFADMILNNNIEVV